MEQKRNMRKSEEKRPLRRHRHRREGNIKCYHKEIGWQTVGYIYVVQVRDKLQAVVNTVMNLQVPQNAGVFLDWLMNFWLLM
jgi:23S rRNA maturation mini-RNase III